MPLQDVMNAPSSFGPLLSEEMQDRDLAVAQKGANLADTMAGVQMKGRENRLARDKDRLLRNFEGRTDSPEFREKMMSIDPDEVRKMEKNIREMDKSQRERTKQYMDQVAARAEMAKTPQAWQEAGFAVPFEERDRIFGATLTYNQAFDRNEEARKSKETGPLKATNERFITTKIAARYEGSKFDPVSKEYVSSSNPKFRNEIARISADAVKIYQRNPNMEGGMTEAANQAYEEFHKKKKQNTFQSSAGPSDMSRGEINRSGVDYTPYF